MAIYHRRQISGSWWNKYSGWWKTDLLGRRWSSTSCEWLLLNFKLLTYVEFDEDPGGGGDDLVGEGDSGGDDDHGNTFPRLHRKLKTNENMSARDGQYKLQIWFPRLAAPPVCICTEFSTFLGCRWPLLKTSPFPGTFFTGQTHCLNCHICDEKCFCPSCQIVLIVTSWAKRKLLILCLQRPRSLWGHLWGSGHRSQVSPSLADAKNDISISKGCECAPTCKHENLKTFSNGFLFLLRLLLQEFLWELPTKSSL